MGSQSIGQDLATKSPEELTIEKSYLYIVDPLPIVDPLLQLKSKDNKISQKSLTRLVRSYKISQTGLTFLL